MNKKELETIYKYELLYYREINNQLKKQNGLNTMVIFEKLRDILDNTI